MKECTKIYELLSAYSDNEVTDSERLLVDRHLAACKDCSAMLEMFHEISDIVIEPDMEVPEALHIGVMNRVRNESVLENPVITEAKVKQRKRFGIMMTRIVPLAACLAVVVLAWQFWGNVGGVELAAAPEAMMDMAPEEAVPEAVSDYIRMTDDADAEWAENEMMYAADFDDEFIYQSRVEEVDFSVAAGMYWDEDAEDGAYYVDHELYTFRAEVLELMDVLILEADYDYELFEAILFVSNITPVRHPGIGGSYLIIENEHITVFDINGELISHEDIPVGAIVEITFFGEILITYPSIIYHVTVIQIIE